MNFKVNKIDGIQINFQQGQSDINNDGNELLFNPSNNPDGTVYTNESAKNLFYKLLNYPEDISLLDAAGIMFPDEQITAIPQETLQTLSLYKNEQDITETLELKDENGGSFYLIKYKNGTTQTLFPDDTSNVRVPQRYGSNEYTYADGVLQKITLERTDYYTNKKKTSVYEANDDGYFVGHAAEGETIQDVLKNLGIEEDSPEAEQFMQLNKKNIKSFNKGRIKSFIVGREMLILPENAIQGMKYLHVNPKNERQKHEERVMRDYNLGFINTTSTELSSNTTWWELSKQNLIDNHKIENPTDAQIAENLIIIRKLNPEDAPLTKGDFVNVTLPTGQDNIEEKYNYKNYTLANLRKTYPADKYDISISAEYTWQTDNLIEITDKKGNKVATVKYNYTFNEIYDEENDIYFNSDEYISNITKIYDEENDIYFNSDEYISNITVQKYDDKERVIEEIEIVPEDEYHKCHTTTYEYIDYADRTECITSTNGIPVYVDIYGKNNFDEHKFRLYIDNNGRRHTTDENNFYLVTYYNNNNQEMYTKNISSGEITSSIADELNNALISKNVQQMKDIISSIDRESLFIIYNAYFDKYGVDLLENIENSSFPQKEKDEFIHTIKSHIDNAIPVKAPENNSVYSFVYLNNILIIKNLKNNTAHTIDFNTRFKGFNYYEQRILISTILQMPPEALEDLSIENRKITRKKNTDTTGSGGYYSSNDYIEIDPEHIRIAPDDENSYLLHIIVHELGHALDWYGYISNDAASDSAKKFKELFIKNVEKYVADNHPIWDEEDTSEKDEVKIRVYATKNIHEMFAECYNWIMTGGLGRNEETDELFIKYFNENLQVAEEMINKIRQLPDKQRYNFFHI